MEISVIVTHYRSPEVLKLALGYLETWLAAYEGDHGEGTAEIIVSDSGTLAHTREMMAGDFEHMTFLPEPHNIGYGRLVNRGVKHARGAFIFIMNADIVLARPEELNSLLAYMREHDEVGIAGPKLLNFDNTHQPSAFRYYTPLTILLRRTPLGKTPWGKKKIATFTLANHPTLLREPTPVDWLMGSALLVRKAHLGRIGVFDERFFMYMEDVDLCRRFWEAGLKIMFYPKAQMYHFHGASSRSSNIFSAFLNKYARIHIKSAYKYFRKHGVAQPRYGV